MSAAATRFVTAEQLLRMASGGKRLELVEGELHEMAPAGWEHGDVSLNLSTPVDSHVRKHDLGKCVAAETGFLLRTNPDTVRAADLAFVSKARLRRLKFAPGFFPGPPDLAVEVLSPWDRLGEVEEKIADWLRAGTKQVWVVHPRQKTVAIYRKNQEPLVLTSKDTLQGGALLPGFKLAVKALFA
jgi:Uma2 family endonuclease